jgi:hypothetical protein
MIFFNVFFMVVCAYFATVTRGSAQFFNIMAVALNGAAVVLQVSSGG